MSDKSRKSKPISKRLETVLDQLENVSIFEGVECFPGRKEYKTSNDNKWLTNLDPGDQTN